MTYTNTIYFSNLHIHNILINHNFNQICFITYIYRYMVIICIYICSCSLSNFQKFWRFRKCVTYNFVQTFQYNFITIRLAIPLTERKFFTEIFKPISMLFLFFYNIQTELLYLSSNFVIKISNTYKTRSVTNLYRWILKQKCSLFNLENISTYFNILSKLKAMLKPLLF